MYDNGATAKRTVNDTESQVERNITEVEQQEENALEALLATFGVNETNLGMDTFLKVRENTLPLPFCWKGDFFVS